MPSLKVPPVARTKSFSSMPSSALNAWDRRDRRFTDADRADLFRFDQRDRRSLRPQHAGECGSRHPARGPSADNRDAA
jgi:hypothetical protein